MTTKITTRSLFALLAFGCCLVIAGGAQAATLLSATFEGGFPPSGWQRTGGNYVAWATTTGSAEINHTGGTGQAAVADSFDVPAGETAANVCSRCHGSEESGTIPSDHPAVDLRPGAGSAYDAALVSPAVALPAGAAGLQMRFRSVLAAWSGDERADVDVSINNGSTWTNLRRWTGGLAANEQVTLPLATYAGQTVRVRFHYYNTQSTARDLYWQVDDVVIETDGTPGPVPGDGELLAVAPADAATIALAVPIFAWSNAAPGLNYRVELSATIAGLDGPRSSLRLPRMGTTDTSYTPTAKEWGLALTLLSRSGASDFYWRVVGDSAEALVVSNVNHVTLDAGALTLTAPAEGATLVAENLPTFTYGYAGGDLTSFSVQISTTQAFTKGHSTLATRPTGRDSVTLSASQWRRVKRALAADPPTTFYWRVVGRTPDRKFAVASGAGTFAVAAPVLQIVDCSECHRNKGSGVLPRGHRQINTDGGGDDDDDDDDGDDDDDDDDRGGVTPTPTPAPAPTPTPTPTPTPVVNCSRCHGSGMSGSLPPGHPRV